MNSSKITTIILFILLSSTIRGQQINTLRLTVDNGLPSLEIRDIIQNEEGFIWIAHRNGISLYDGIRFTTYSQKQGLTHPSQSFIDQDKNGGIYTLSDDKEIFISKFRNNQWENITTIDSVAQQAKVTGFAILDIDNADYPEMAFSTHNYGCYVYSSEKWKHYSKEIIGCNIIYDLVKFKDRFLIATDKGIFEYQDQKFIFFMSDKSPVYSLYYNDDALAVVREKEIDIIYNKKVTSHIKTYPTITWDTQNTAVQVLFSTIDEKIYVGDETQFYKIDAVDPTIEEIDTKTGFTAEGVTNLFYDHDNNVWASSNRGISIIHYSPFVNYSIENILPDNEVSAIIEIEPGKFLLGQNTLISTFEDNSIKKVVPLSEDKNYNVYYRVQDFTTDGKGSVYFASSKGGFGKYKNDKIEWLKNPKFNNVNYFSSVYYDIATDRLWCAAAGLFGYLNTENNFVEVTTNIPQINIRKIFKLSDGAIYAAVNRNGFLRIDSTDHIRHHYFDKGSLEDNNIFSMYLDNNDVLWLGTSIGLLYYYEKQFFRELEGYPILDIPVYQINSDKDGNIWIGTELSVMKLTGNTLIEFTASEGYLSGETNRAAFAITQDNHILFGGSSGLSIYNSQNDHIISPKQPRCEITGINMDSTKYSPYANHSFAYNQNNFLITYTPISFSGRKNIIQQIMLAGLDSEWQTINDKYTSSAFYSSLRPGTYNFLYRVSNNGGRTWCRAKISGNIVIAEPFFRKWWFIASLFIVFMAFIFLIVYLITRNQYSKTLEQEVENRTIELKNSNKEKDMFFSIIAHDLKSPFNAIIGFSEILKNDYDSFNEEEKKLFIDNIYDASENTYKLIEKLLDWSRAKTGRLQYNPQMIDLSVIGTTIINTYRNAASKKGLILKSLIGYHSKVYADQNLLETVFRNLVSNAIKYTNPKGEIVISANRTGDYITIYIEDNGIGMEKEQLEKLFLIKEKTSTPGTQEESGTGLGLLVAKEFIEVNGGNISVKSTPGKGSIFSFTVPAKNLQA